MLVFVVLPRLPLCDRLHLYNLSRDNRPLHKWCARFLRRQVYRYGWSGWLLPVSRRWFWTGCFPSKSRCYPSGCEKSDVPDGCRMKAACFPHWALAPVAWCGYPVCLFPFRWRPICVRSRLRIVWKRNCSAVWLVPFPCWRKWIRSRHTGRSLHRGWQSIKSLGCLLWCRLQNCAAVLRPWWGRWNYNVRTICLQRFLPVRVRQTAR